MKIIYSELARKELAEAKSFYNMEVEGLGMEFINEIKKAEKRIAQFPEAFPLVGREIRKCTIRKFPYNLLYSIEKDFILIIAAHQHRKPFYWVKE